MSQFENEFGRKNKILKMNDDRDPSQLTTHNVSPMHMYFRQMCPLMQLSLRWIPASIGQKLQIFFASLKICENVWACV